MSQRLDGSCGEYKLFIYTFLVHLSWTLVTTRCQHTRLWMTNLGLHLHRERDAFGTHAKEPRVVVLDRRESA